MTSTLLTLAVLLPAAPAPAPKDTTPKGPAPRVVVIQVHTDGLPYFQHNIIELVPQQQTRQVQVGQQVRQVVETKMIQVTRTVTLRLDGEDVQVYGADGKKIDPKEVRKLVRKPVAALVSTDGKPVDPFYLRLAREGTLVIVVSTPATPEGGRDISIPEP